MKTDHKANDLPRNMVTLLVRFGDELTLIQRLGYAAWSFALMLLGLMLLQAFVPELRNGDLADIFWVAIALVPLALGTAGIVNVLRFPKS